MTIAEYQSRDDALAVMKMVVAELDRVAPGRYASALVNQLVYTPFQGMSLLHQHVVPEIEHLENDALQTRTKKEDYFRSPELRYVWKKHFYLPQFLPKNIVNAWKLSPNSRATSFEDKFNREFKRHQSAPTNKSGQQLSSLIAQQLIDGTKTRPLTGEYIVFEKYNDKNYYLCISRHSEKAAISKWVNHARRDFEFLNNLNENEGAQ